MERSSIPFRMTSNTRLTATVRSAAERREPRSSLLPVSRERSLHIKKGEEHFLTFGESMAHDIRCKRCGSFLYSVVRDGEYVHVTLGTLMDTPTIRPTAHIFVASKASWHTITDNLPQHDEFA